MQDRYAGDVGDFGKLALLRALSPGFRLGVCWYLTDGTGEGTNDGKHLRYLLNPERFRPLDEGLFDGLLRFRASFAHTPKARTVANLIALGVLPSSTPYHGIGVPRAAQDRRRWLEGMVRAMRDADLVFLDPDNGIEGKSLTAKSVSIGELLALRRENRALVLYHHQTRFKGGASAEFMNISRRLRAVGLEDVCAIRLRPYSSRFYFLIGGGALLRARLVEFSRRAGPRFCESFG